MRGYTQSSWSALYQLILSPLSLTLLDYFCSVQMNTAGSAFTGASFHCYAGDVTNQTLFHNAFPSKEVYQTECSGTLGTDWWSNMKVGFLLV